MDIILIGIGMVVCFVAGILFGRRNRKKVEAGIAGVKEKAKETWDDLGRKKG